MRAQGRCRLARSQLAPAAQPQAQRRDQARARGGAAPHAAADLRVALPSAWGCPRARWPDLPGRRRGAIARPASQAARPGATSASSPGELLHLDTKKLARFEQPGHRVTGDRTRYTPRAGWQALHVAIDDHSRVGFSQMLADETARSACAFLLAALRYYASLGVRIAQRDDRQRLGLQVAPLCQAAAPRWASRHIRTRPYTPRTNGKAERFIQTAVARVGLCLGATRVHSIAPMNCNPGCITTTSIGHTRPSHTDHRPPASASTGTTS